MAIGRKPYFSSRKLLMSGHPSDGGAVAGSADFAGSLAFVGAAGPVGSAANVVVVSSSTAAPSIQTRMR
jgi:hypothetical protein